MQNRIPKAFCHNDISKNGSFKHLKCFLSVKSVAKLAKFTRMNILKTWEINQKFLTTQKACIQNKTG